MDLEARAHRDPSEALWLRLLTCTPLIEKEVRNGLREQFATTLPRFDLMAQFERAPEGMKMNELSRRMMATGGNLTASPITRLHKLPCKVKQHSRRQAGAGMKHRIGAGTPLKGICESGRSWHRPTRAYDLRPVRSAAAHG
jgi:hypothetical protein